MTESSQSIVPPASRERSPNDSSPTKTSRVYSELKGDITSGEIKPGTHLVRRDLVKRFNVSLSIVNEALGRLSSDGLVESQEMKGTRVIALSEEDLKNELILREAIERHVVRLLAENATDEILNYLLAEARTLDKWTNEFGYDGASKSLLHLEFHLKMARSTGCSLLEEAIKRTGIRVLLTTRWLDNQRLPHPPDFHEQLVVAIMQRDSLLADETMKEHLHFGEDQRE